MDSICKMESWLFKRCASFERIGGEEEERRRRLRRVSQSVFGPRKTHQPFTLLLPRLWSTFAPNLCPRGRAFVILHIGGRVFERVLRRTMSEWSFGRRDATLLVLCLLAVSYVQGVIQLDNTCAHGSDYIQFIGFTCIDHEEYARNASYSGQWSAEGRYNLMAYTLINYHLNHIGIHIGNITYCANFTVRPKYKRSEEMFRPSLRPSRQLLLTP